MPRNQEGRLAKLAALAERDPSDVEAVRAYNDECKRISVQGEGIEAFKRAWDPAPLLASDERIGRAIAAYLAARSPQDEDHEHDWRAFYKRGIPGQLPDSMICNICREERPYGPQDEDHEGPGTP